MSLDDLAFQALERLIQQMWLKNNVLVVKFAISRMGGIHIPGRDPADVVQESWILFAKRLAGKGYRDSLLRPKETVETREERLRHLIFYITERKIRSEWRKKKQKAIKAQINADFNADFDSVISKIPVATPVINRFEEVCDVQQTLEQFRLWCATQTKQPWHIVSILVSITVDDQLGDPTHEDLAAEASHRLGKSITVDQIRYAEELLRTKARNTPALQHLLPKRNE